MRLAGFVSAVLAAFALAASVIPASAAAKRVVRTTAPGPAATFSLPAGDGHFVTVEANGSQVLLEVEKGEAATEYSVRGHGGRRVVKGDFGELGRIAVRFKPRGRAWRNAPPKRCEGKDVVIRRGVFVGTIRFRGEGGYLGIDRKRVRGVTKTTPRWRCRPQRGGGFFGLVERLIPLEEPTLAAFVPGSERTFVALRESGPDGPGLIVFLVLAKERRGPVRIERFAFQLGEPEEFTVKPGLRRATVRPSKPFEGSAELVRGADGSIEWSGSLAVSLPGAPSLPLTGDTFTADLAKPKTLAQLVSLLGQPGLAAFF
jgi:hypothetical protein